MKQCSECNANCYDIENYCMYCGNRLAPSNIHCEYCNVAITDMTATNCDGCGAPIILEIYSNNLKLTKCISCNQSIPADSIYCAHCGIHLESAIKEKEIKNPGLMLLKVAIIIIVTLLIFVVGVVGYVVITEHDAMGLINYSHTYYDDY